MECVLVYARHTVHIDHVYSTDNGHLEMMGRKQLHHFQGNMKTSSIGVSVCPGKLITVLATKLGNKTCMLVKQGYNYCISFASVQSELWSKLGCISDSVVPCAIGTGRAEDRETEVSANDGQSQLISDCLDPPPSCFPQGP